VPAQGLRHQGKRIVIGRSITINVRIVMQNDIQQRAVDLDVDVVVNEAQFAEFIHEEADP
jgi:hypothetical protein